MLFKFGVTISLAHPFRYKLLYLLTDLLKAKFDVIDFRGRDVRILEDDYGYIYSSAVAMKNGDIKWRCSKRNAFKCIAFLITRGEYIVRARPQHNHEPCSVHRKNTVRFVWIFADTRIFDMINFEPATFLNKAKGTVLLDSDGTEYFKVSKGSLNGKPTRWRCSRYRLNCKASVLTLNGFVVERKNEHNHWIKLQICYYTEWPIS